MGQLAIIGHKERGREVIEILKALGGQELPLPCDGNYPNEAYYIKDGYITSTTVLYANLVYVTMEELDALYLILGRTNNWRSRIGEIETQLNFLQSQMNSHGPNVTVNDVWVKLLRERYDLLKEKEGEICG